jgi:hypothetical protein
MFVLAWSIVFAHISRGFNSCLLSFTLHGRELTCTAATSLNKWSTVEKICRKCQNNKDSLQNQGVWKLWRAHIWALACSVAITMNLGTSSHRNGVIFYQNPPFFWRHFVDWTKYRIRSSSYYTAQWTGQARVAVRKACWYYFVPNSKRAVSIMSSYGHRRVSFHKPLVIVSSLAQYL